MDDFDSLFSIEQNDEVVTIENSCPYSNEMKALNIEVQKCDNQPKNGRKYCNFHGSCNKCRGPTDNKKVRVCHNCICNFSSFSNFSNCTNMKIDGSDNCGQHHCSCGKIKEKKINYCTQCTCSYPLCTDKKQEECIGCIKHTCPHCYKLLITDNTPYCENKDCQCQSPGCISIRINKVACKSHTCRRCLDLYDDALSFMTGPVKHRSKTVHAIIDTSHVEIMNDAHEIYYCPNMKVTPCKSLELGYTKSNICSGFVPVSKYGTIEDMCFSCMVANRCDTHIHLVVRSLHPLILKKGYRLCEGHCLDVGLCLNCNVESWVYGKETHGPELCENCIDSFKSCNCCSKVFAKDSIEFLKYDNSSANICVNCLSKECDIDSDIRKCYLINYRVNIISYLEPINKVYYKFNPHKINYDQVFELVLNMMWECNSREMYMYSIISFMKDKNKFMERLQMISKNMQVEYTNESYRLDRKLSESVGLDHKLTKSYFLSENYKKINLLALFVRCAMLPKDLFIMIINML